MYFNKKRIALSIVIIAALFFVYYFHVQEYFTFDVLKAKREQIAIFVSEHYILSVLLYIGTYIGIAALSIPVSVVLTLAGGFLFGTVLGSLYTIIGASIGATFAFLIIRYLLGDILQQKYKEQLKDFNKEFERYGAYYLLSLHLIPAVPFFLITILTGLTTVSLRTFFVTTVLGIIPGTFVYSFAGQQLATLNSLQDIFSARLALALTFLGILGLAALILPRLLHFKHN